MSKERKEFETPKTSLLGDQKGMLFTKTESQEKEIRGWGNLILATEIRDVSGATVV